jgi:hypothetical protein
MRSEREIRGMIAELKAMPRHWPNLEYRMAAVALLENVLEGPTGGMPACECVGPEGCCRCLMWRLGHRLGPPPGTRNIRAPLT